MMAKKFFSKRLIAAILVLVMMANQSFFGASAAANNEAPELVRNYTDTYYKQDGTVGTAEDWEIHLSKTAAVTDQDNVYDITLTVQTKDTQQQLGGSVDGAAVLVLDVSSSMVQGTGTCAKCGLAQNHSNHRGYRKVCTFQAITHLELLKDAVKSFLDSYVEDAAEGDKRLVAIAKFATDAETVLTWIDVNNEANMATVKEAVDNMKSTSGTNIEAGLALGRNLLTLSAVNSIPLANQSLILFSDGAPSVAVGNANNTSVTKVESDNRGISGSGTRTTDDLDDILADVSAKKLAVAYNTDADLLKSVFGEENVITSTADSLALDLAEQAGQIVTSKTTASTITDPMGTGVSMVTVTTDYNADTMNWDLSKITPVIADGIATYTITYQVEIDPEQVAADPQYPGYTVLTPANGKTSLDYTYGEENTHVNAEFNVPDIRGIRSFTVSYAYTGAVPQGAPVVPETKTYKAGTSVTVAEEPTLENYIFSGWSKKDFVMPAADVVIYGSWTENVKYDYSVNYNANFGMDPEVKADAENVTGTYATTYSITVDENTFVRDNHTFIGWNTEANGTGKAYAVSDVVALTAENSAVTLYAQWLELPKYAYSVIYNANFGAAPETRNDSENVTGTYAAAHSVNVDENYFVRPNYTFIGWNTQADGKGISYTVSEAVALTAEHNTVILYAQWEENAKFDYSVFYNANFGVNPEMKADAENVKGVYETSYRIAVDANTFVRPNYTFIGWNTQADGKGISYTVSEAVALTAENNSVTLYAQWIENAKFDYSVIYNANFGANPEGKADAENVKGIYETAYSITVDANTFVRENYTFIGWNTQADGKGISYTASDVIALTAENNSVTLYAQWVENAKFDYSVIYNANFGANPATKADSENIRGTYAATYAITVDTNSFNRPNYVFLGWSETPNGTVAYLPGDVIRFEGSGQKTLYAQWQENAKYSYTVIYNGNGGALADGTLAYGDSENAVNVYDTSWNVRVDANTFVRKNYTFVGWNTKADGTGKAYTASDVVALTAKNNTVTLYAQWTENAKFDYSVIYNANFGAAPAIKADSENVKGVYESSYSISVDTNTFVRENFTFVGWNTKADGTGKAYTASDVITLTAKNNTVTLYAQWIENAKYDYSVNYNANFGFNPEVKADAENVKGIYETFYSITVDTNTFVRPNFTFAGWNTKADGTGKAYAAFDAVALTAKSNTVTLYAQWIENPKYDYSVIYNANFGFNPEVKADAENVKGIYETFCNITVDTNTFVRPNFTFAGWNTKADGTGKAYAASDVVALTAKNNTVTLYAQWIENPKYDYSLFYNANFGSDPEVKADAENVTGIYELFYSITVDENTFVRPNYTFVGWNTQPDGSGRNYNPRGAVFLPAAYNSVTLYAQWIENPKYDYAVIYNANFGVNPEIKADSENVTGTYATSLRITVDANTFVRENYTFVGWNTEANGTGKAYSADQVVALTVENSTVTLYAQWVENAKFDYSVTYNANFGMNPEVKADAENIRNTYLASYDITVDENTFVRPNYTFVGWSVSAEGQVAYLPGDNIHFEVSGSLVLYAQWMENSKFSYTVIYNGNGGTLADGALSYGDSENVIGVYETSWNITVDTNTFVRENHTFAGWNTEANGTGTAYTAADVIALTAENNTVTLYAQWIENAKFDYSVIYNANFGANPEVKADAENVIGVYETSWNITVDANTFIRPNYTFIGWNTEADGTSIAYTAEDVIALTAEKNAVTLYAQWIENAKFDYSVIYDSNFGETSQLVFDSENVTGVYETSWNITVDANTFVRTGYTFVGWNTKADGTGTAYAAEDVITLTAQNNTVTLYAQWTINSYAYTVQYWVRINEEAYVLFTGDLTGAPVGETVPFGTVIDKDYLDARSLPAILADEAYAYDFTALEGITVTGENDVVNVYYTCIYEEIPDDDIPMGDLPQTGDSLGLFMAMATLVGSGTGAVVLKRKKDSEDEEN